VYTLKARDAGGSCISVDLPARKRYILQ